MDDAPWKDRIADIYDSPGYVRLAVQARMISRRNRLWFLAACLVIILILAGCASTEQSRRDQFGNLYPVECRRDLSDIGASIEIVAHDDSLLPVVNGVRAVGAKYPGGVIFISDRLSGWRLADVKQHELCHVLMGAWHP